MEESTFKMTERSFSIQEICDALNIPPVGATLWLDRTGLLPKVTIRTREEIEPESKKKS